MKIKTMFDLSLETASALFTPALLVAIAAAAVAALSGGLALVAYTIQSKHSQESLAQSSASSAQANKQTAQANATAEMMTKVNIKLSVQLEKERKELQELQKNLPAVFLDSGTRNTIASTLAKQTFSTFVIIRAASNNLETLDLAKDLTALLIASGVDARLQTGAKLEQGITGIETTLFDSPDSKVIKKALDYSKLSISYKITNASTLGCSAMITVYSNPEQPKR